MCVGVCVGGSVVLCGVLGVVLGVGGGVGGGGGGGGLQRHSGCVSEIRPPVQIESVKMKVCVLLSSTCTTVLIFHIFLLIT